MRPKNTMCWKLIVSCNLVLKRWLSYCASLTFPAQKMLGLLPCLQAVWPCAAPQGAEGTTVLCVSPAEACPVWPTWWVSCEKVAAATPSESYLAYLSSIAGMGECYYSAFTADAQKGPQFSQPALAPLTRKHVSVCPSLISLCLHPISVPSAPFLLP